MSWVEQVLRNLSTNGYRVTEPRRAILEQVVRYPHPFSTEQLYKDLGGESGPIGRATVYRTVEMLLADGWLGRVHWSASGSSSDEHAYVPVEPGHQHHMVCTNCGTVAAFQGCDIDALLGGLAQRMNFRVQSHWLEISGLCQMCQRQAG